MKLGIGILSNNSILENLIDDELNKLLDDFQKKYEHPYPFPNKNVRLTSSAKLSIIKFIKIFIQVSFSSLCMRTESSGVIIDMMLKGYDINLLNINSSMKKIKSYELAKYEFIFKDNIDEKYESQCCKLHNIIYMLYAYTKNKFIRKSTSYSYYSLYSDYKGDKYLLNILEYIFNGANSENYVDMNVLDNVENTSYFKGIKKSLGNIKIFDNEETKNPFYDHGSYDINEIDIRINKITQDSLFIYE